MEHWFESYGHWDPRSQLIFSTVVVLLTFVLVILLGVWILSLLRTVCESVGMLFGRWPVETYVLTPEDQQRLLRLARKRKAMARRREKEEEKDSCTPQPQPTTAGMPSTRSDAA